MTDKESKIQETFQDSSKKSIDNVISELSRDQCQLILFRLGIVFRQGSDQVLRELIQSYFNVEDLSESAIREVQIKFLK